MDAELLRKLSQRLRIVEGNRAQVNPATANNQPATGQFGQRGRVQVPQWVVHRGEATEGSTPDRVRHRSPRFSRGTSVGSDCVDPVTTVEQLRQELAQMQQERDDAIEAADAAEAAAQSWGESLNAEAAHLRRLCSTMAQDQSAVSGQVSDLRARRHQADSLEEGDAIVDPHEELSALHGDITDLTVELSELRAQRTSLEARASTLRQELETQLAEESELRRLLHEAKGRNQASSSKDCPAFLPLAGELPPLRRSVIYEAGDDEEEFDIEFSYECGLELCNRKSVPSLMSLARGVSKVHSAKEAIPDQDHSEPTMDVEDSSALQNSAADSTGGLAAGLLARGRGLSSLFALK